ncbi:MAG TPA: hypothetical protein VM537_04810 [Anaerolineae bacterium]|nr:hypothetical protein [Anaerolineae bacterium]
MTAEIAIMNRQAIALAADSAATVELPREHTQSHERKIFTSAHKVFALSKYHPVGIMVYGRADLLQVPWEVIVKMYRRRLGPRSFDTVEEYAKDFLGFLENANPLFPDAEQTKHVYGMARSFFEQVIRDEITEEAEVVAAEQGEITRIEHRKITSRVIRTRQRELAKAAMAPGLPDTHVEDIVKEYGDILNEAIEEVFERASLSKASRGHLRTIGASIMSKDIWPLDVSGVVIGGFGEAEYFPALWSCDIAGLACNRLKCKTQLSDQTTHSKQAGIYAFAQQEMVHAFLYGADPSLRRFMDLHLSHVFEEYPSTVVDALEGLDEEERTRLLRVLTKSGASLLEFFRKTVDDRVQEQHAAPIIRVVAVLPKDELAIMAETLVNLTSFKRKVSMESETVGGPIDVALITKGDGLIWVKRKHYFDATLNPQFFANYYREAYDGQQEATGSDL